MFYRIVMAIIALALLKPMTAAQDENPTIGILGMGAEYIEIPVSAILDMLVGYSFINPEERAALDRREDIEGE